MNWIKAFTDVSCLQAYGTSTCNPPASRASKQIPPMTDPDRTHHAQEIVELSHRLSYLLTSLHKDLSRRHYCYLLRRQ